MVSAELITLVKFHGSVRCAASGGRVHRSPAIGVGSSVEKAPLAVGIVGDTDYGELRRPTLRVPRRASIFEV